MLALIFVVRAGFGFQFQTMGSVGEALRGPLGMSSAELGTLIGIFFLPGLVLAIPAGYAGRHAADKALVALGLAALAIGGGLCAGCQLRQHARRRRMGRYQLDRPGLRHVLRRRAALPQSALR